MLVHGRKRASYTSGLAAPLGASVRDALHAIAATGDVCAQDDHWVLFGEVTELVSTDPLHVQVRRMSMLLQDVIVRDEWSQFDLHCPDLHQRVDLTEGMLIGVYVKACHRPQAGRICADHSVPIWNISQLDRHMPWNASHLFAGAYEGWLRAMWWLQQMNLGFSFASHTCVDWSQDVMKTWSYNHGCGFQHGPIGVDYNPTNAFSGICADVGELTLLRATSNKANLVMSLSPPCPSWSKGGRNSGLATDDGFCFLDAIQHVARVRPIMALFECSDGIELHPHWRVLSAALQLGGYKKVWSQDVAIHQLTCNQRTRWLAVWIRQDIPCPKLDERFLCSIPRRMSWDDVKHKFHLPADMAEALKLTPEQLQIYGDRQLLPPSKRARVGDGASMNQVLDQRLLQQGEYLPTLCASYTGQHLLQRDHLEAKGIFATLVRDGEGFRFVDPFTFVALFGTSEWIGLPADLRKAFHQLGNAISQIHALVAILFGFEGVLGDTPPKLALAQQCWNDRLTVDKALIRRCGDMFVLQPFDDFIAKAYPSVITWQPWLAGSTMIRFGDDQSLIPVNVPAQTRLVDHLIEHLDLASHHLPLLQLVVGERTLAQDTLWDALPSGDLVVKMGPRLLCTLHVVRAVINAEDADPIVSPTQPWGIEDHDPELDHLQEAQQAGFFHVLEHVCQDPEPVRVGKVLLLQQDGTFEWIRDANLDRLGSIPSFHSQDSRLHFFKANQEACQRLLGVHVILAIKGTYEPISPDKWILLAGGQELRWCKICQAPRTITPRQCNALFEQQCNVTLRNMIECRLDQPMMLINGDVLWSGSCTLNEAPPVFGGMDRLSDQPSCNIAGDSLVARLLQFNLEPGAIAMDEMVFHFDFLQLLMPSIC